MPSVLAWSPRFCYKTVRLTSGAHWITQVGYFNSVVTWGIAQMMRVRNAHGSMNNFAWAWSAAELAYLQR